MKPNTVYQWEMETVDGVILKQYNDDGSENTWKSLDPDKIVRVSFLPKLPILPKHDLLIDIGKGEKFIKRFGRGFLRQKVGFNLSEYLNCIETNRYRFWLFSCGNTLITRNDYEVYI